MLTFKLRILINITRSNCPSNRSWKYVRFRFIHVANGSSQQSDSDKGEDFVLLPRQAGYAMSTIYDWNYTTVAMPNVANRSIGIPQGKVIGGSSVLNGMVLPRGAAADYDTWGELGNPGWSWKDLLPYFKKVSQQIECLLLFANSRYSRKSSLLQMLLWRNALVPLRFFQTSR